MLALAIVHLCLSGDDGVSPHLILSVVYFFEVGGVTARPVTAYVIHQESGSESVIKVIVHEPMGKSPRLPVRLYHPIAFVVSLAHVLPTPGLGNP